MRSPEWPLEGRPSHNIFFAIRPSPDARERITRLMDRQFERAILRGSRVSRECLHVTLYDLGCYDVVPCFLIDGVCGVISNLKMTTFDIALNCMMSFENEYDLCLRVLTGDDGLIGFDNLHALIYQLLRKGHPRSRKVPRIGTPHLTLSHETSVWPERFIKPVRWSVEEFCLIDSPYGESHHNVLERWPLLRR